MTTIGFEEIIVFALAIFGLGVGISNWSEVWADRSKVLAADWPSEDQKRVVRSGPRLIGFVCAVLTSFSWSAGVSMYRLPPPAALGGTPRLITLALFVALSVYGVWVLWKEREDRWEVLRPESIQRNGNDKS